ncbi:MAG TPA: TadE family protein [Lapillicoccus sp.]|nr:TadE family protein [Lapillicoccus sp.]
MRRADAPRRDRGSAIAEFAMVGGLVVLLGMGVFQLALVLYVRNALVSNASEGARLGARAGASLDEGAARTRDLITRDLNASYAQGVSVTRATTSTGVQVVEVTVSAPVPVIGLVGPTGVMTVTGRAYQEGQ